jgi:hypothetical protein
LTNKLPSFITDRLEAGETVLAAIDNGQRRDQKAYFVATDRRLLRMGRNTQKQFAILDALEYSKDLSIDYVDVSKRAGWMRLLLGVTCAAAIAAGIYLRSSNWTALIVVICLTLVYSILTIADGYLQISDKSKPKLDPRLMNSKNYDDYVKWQLLYSPFTARRAKMFGDEVNNIIRRHGS